MSYASAAVLPDSPVLYYQLTETGGASAADSSGNANTGTASADGILGAGTGISADPVGTKAAVLTAFDSILAGAATALPTGNAAWSMEAWVNTPSVPSNVGVMELGDHSGGNGVVLGFVDPNQLFVDWNASSLAVASLPDLTGAYHHLALTYDGTTITLYLDGVSVGTATPAPLTLPAQALLGQTDIDAVPGTVAQAAWYATTLSGARIFAHYDFGTFNATRTRVVENTDLDISLTPLTGSTTVELLVPAGVTPQQVITERAITILTKTVPLDGTGFWSIGLEPNGDIIPAGTAYRVTEPGGRVTVLSFAYSASPIVLSTLYQQPDHLGMILMVLSGVDIGGDLDTTLTTTAAIAQDALWTGGAGIGQLLSSNNPLPFNADGFANVAVWGPRSSELSVATYYQITNTRSGTPIAFTIPDTYTDATLGVTDTGDYNGGTTYAANDIAIDPATSIPYLSKAGSNSGHALTNATWWTPYSGAHIVANLRLPGAVSTSPVATEAMITTSKAATRSVATPATLADDISNLLVRIASLEQYGATGRETFGNFHLFI